MAQNLNYYFFLNVGLTIVFRCFFRVQPPLTTISDVLSILNSHTQTFLEFSDYCNVLLDHPFLEFIFPLCISHFSHIVPLQLIFPLQQLMSPSKYTRLLEQPKFTKTLFAFHKDFNAYMYNLFLKFDLIGFH